MKTTGNFSIFKCGQCRVCSAWTAFGFSQGFCVASAWLCLSRYLVHVELLEAEAISAGSQHKAHILGGRWELLAPDSDRERTQSGLDLPLRPRLSLGTPYVQAPCAVPLLSPKLSGALGPIAFPKSAVKGRIPDALPGCVILAVRENSWCDSHFHMHAKCEVHVHGRVTHLVACSHPLNGRLSLKMRFRTDTLILLKTERSW